MGLKLNGAFGFWNNIMNYTLLKFILVFGNIFICKIIIGMSTNIHDEFLYNKPFHFSYHSLMADFGLVSGASYFVIVAGDLASNG